MTKRKYQYTSLALLSFAIVVFFWWLVTGLGIVKEFFLPSPINVMRALYDLFSEGNFLHDIVVSCIRIIVGFIIAAVLAIPLGVLMGMKRRVEAFVEPLIDFIRYTPIPAFIPLIILWFGIGELEKIVVIAASVFFQLVLMVANSVAQIPQEAIESAKTLGASNRQVLTRVVWPAALPDVIDDSRVSVGWAWAGLIFAEIIGATSGIGFVIIQSQRLLQTDNVMAAVLVIGVIGVLTDYLMKRFRTVMFPWLPKKYD